MAYDDAYYKMGREEGYVARRIGDPRPDFEAAHPHESLTPHEMGFLAGWDEADAELTGKPRKSTSLCFSNAMLVSFCALAAWVLGMLIVAAANAAGTDVSWILESPWLFILGGGAVALFMPDRSA